jgi:hypothetical protein
VDEERFYVGADVVDKEYCEGALLLIAAERVAAAA